MIYIKVHLFFFHFKSIFELLSWIFHFSYFIFKPLTFHWFYFFIICISLLIFCIWWEIVTVLFFPPLSMILFSPLNRFIMAALKSLLLNLTSGSSYRQFLLLAFCVCMDINFLFLYMCFNLVETGYFKVTYWSKSTYWFSSPLGLAFFCCLLVYLLSDLAVLF